MSQIDITVTVTVTITVAGEQPDPRAASQWLAAQILDLTGIAVTGCDAGQANDEDGDPAADYQVAAIAFPRA
jgi:hypothetical protein